MPKKGIHPKWYSDAKLVVNGEVVAIIGATKPELRVEVWSGNHPFYTGEMRIVDTEGQVDRFYKRLQARQEYLDEKRSAADARTSPGRPVDELELPKRALDGLKAAGIATVGQLLEKLFISEEEILSIDGFGRKSLADTKKKLRQWGYKLPSTAE